MERLDPAEKSKMDELEPKGPPAAKPDIGKGNNEPKAETTQTQSIRPIQSPHPTERPYERPPQSGPHTSEHKRQQKHHPNITDWIIAGATVGMLIATGVSIGVAYTQWRSMDDQTNMMKTTLQTTERAWVTVKNSELCIVDKIGCLESPIIGKKIFNIQFQNTGHSPALHVTVTGHCTRPKLPANFANECALSNTPSRAVIGPGGSLFSRIADPRNGSTDQAVPLFSIGKIDYDDIFGKHHWTTFCYESPYAGTSDMSVCPQGNDVDKQEN